MDYNAYMKTAGEKYAMLDTRSMRRWHFDPVKDF